jgi:hypothetical protein
MPVIETIKRHVYHLSVEIGPRGSTTPSEQRAADYAAQVYRELGLAPLTEPFKSARSAWRPFGLGTGLVLLAEVVFWVGGQAGAIVAALLALLTLLSLILELSFKPNPLRWLLPRGDSHNVAVRLEPSAQTRRTIVLVGHLDTHRTPLAFRSEAWFAFYQAMTQVTFAAVVLILAVFGVSIFVAWEPLRPLSLIPSVPVLILFLIALQADFTPYTRGANDNATGAAMVMEFVERLTREPLRHSAVWAVNTGCEEVGAYGAAKWVERHREELDETIYLVLDTVGGPGSGPCYLTQETLIFPFKSDPELIHLADELSAEHPALGAYPAQQKAAYTEGAIGINAGLRCLTFVNYRPDGVLPNWHKPTDVFENVDWDVVRRTEAFVWELIQALDAQLS